MLGNDLVFLPEMNVPVGNRFKRYLKKVFLDEEQEWIRSVDDKKIAIALLWSLKESAYKIWAKKTGERKWNPKQFFVINYPELIIPITSKSPKSGLGFESLPVFQSSIQTPLGTILGKSLLYQDYIASYAVDSKKDWNDIYWENEFHNERKTQSEQVRAIYQKRLISEGLSKTKQVDFSFSHDGPMIGYAFTINQTLNNEFRTTERAIKG